MTNPTRGLRVRAAAFATALLLAPAVAAPAAAQERADLAFDWGEGTAQVTLRTRTVTAADGADQTGSSTMTSTLTVERDGAGWILRYSDFDFGEGLGLDDLGDVSGMDPERLSSVIEAVRGATPDVRIDADGEFAGLASEESLQPLMDAIAGLFDEMLALAPMPQFQQMRDQMMVPETWIEATRAGWHEQIGKWRGSWVVGESRADSTEFPNPLGGEPIAMAQTLQFEGRVDCGAGSGACLAFTSIARSDDAFRDQMESIMADMMVEMGVPANMAPTITSLDTTTRTRVVFEADGMRPVESEAVVSSFMVMAMMGQEQVIDQQQTQTTTWAWGG